MSTKKDDERSADDTSPKILSKPSSPTLSENSTVFPADKPSTSSAKKFTDKLKKEKPPSTTVDRVKSQQSSNDKGRSEKPIESSKSNSDRPGQSLNKNSNQPQQQDGTVPAERKVSRYSERRNKIKEKQTLKLESTDVATEEKEIEKEV